MELLLTARSFNREEHTRAGTYRSISSYFLYGSEGLKQEAALVFSMLVEPHWGKELHGFPETLYGYMMMCFAQIDLLSSYWQGLTSSKGQTPRMTAFMDQYISSNQEANRLAVNVWRHKLMHTSEPRILHHQGTSKAYHWLLHWGSPHLPQSLHYTFTETADTKILNLGLFYLIDDIKRGLESYLAELSASSLLQANYTKVKSELSSYTFS
jgi:hypothetical protein